jgi:transposase-like protein
MVAVAIRRDIAAGDLRRQARLERDGRVASRLLALAAVLDGVSREQAARIGGMDRQTLRDWVHRFNEAGVEGDLVSFPGKCVGCGKLTRGLSGQQEI